MNITFKKLVLFSVFTVLLGVGLVYAAGYEFGPRNSIQTSTASPRSQAPAGLPPIIVAHLFVFAYFSDGFVQASVMVSGAESLNGTTTTDLQNPLVFIVDPGVYFVSGTYNSAPPQNATVNVTAMGSYGEAVLNFGSSPTPPLGHLIVSAWDWTGQGGTFVQASVMVSGAESLNGTIAASYLNPSVFTVIPGVYSVFATYDSALPQNAIVDVTAGRFTITILDFSPYPPP